MAIYPITGSARMADTEAELTASNPLLGMGEILVARDTGVSKIGPGHWASLPVLNITPEQMAAESALTGTFQVTAGSPSGGDDAAVFAAAQASLPANGGTIRLRAGTYLLPSGFAFTKRVSLVGEGAGWYETSATRIECSSQTGNCLTFGVAGSAMRGVAVVNTSSVRPTAGAGVLVTAGNGMRIDSVLVDGFFVNVQFDQGFYYSIASSAFLNPRSIGLWFRNTASGQSDHGDQIVQGCVISKFGDTVDGGTAVRWESGGGLRFIGNKINGGTQPGYTSTARFTFGLQLAVADGVATSVFPITGNSIENCTTLIHITQAGPLNTGQIFKIPIVGNEIAIGTTGIGIDPAVADKVGSVLIDGNVIANLGTSIFARRVKGIAIGANLHEAINTAVAIEAETTDATVVPQNVVGVNKVLWADNTVSSTSHGPFQNAKVEDSREVPTTTSTSVATALYSMTMPQNAAGIIEFTVSGAQTSSGAFMRRYRRAWVRATGAVTLTTLGTDEAAGHVGPVVDFDTATTSGDVKIGVRSGTTGEDVAGRCSLVVSGPVYLLRKS